MAVAQTAPPKQSQSPAAPYVFNDPRLEWAETPQGGMTNVQGPPLEKVKQPLEQMWPVQKQEQEQESVGQGWPQQQEGQGWPQQQDTQTQQSATQGWPQPPQKQDGQGWPTQTQTQVWPQQETQVQQEQQQVAVSQRWPQQPEKQEGQGWPQPGQKEPEQFQQQQQVAQGWPQPGPQNEQQVVPLQDQQKQAEQADMGPVPGGWPQSQSHHEESNVPGGWPQPPQAPQAPPQGQAFVEVRPLDISQKTPAQENTQKTPQQQAFTPAPIITPAASVPHTQPPPVKEEPEEPHPLDNIEQFYADSIGRFIDMIQAEVAAQTDQEKLKIFTDFMENEYFIRGQRYPTALGDPPSRQSSVYGKLPGVSYGTPKEEKDLKGGLEQVAEVVVENKPVEPKQKPAQPKQKPVESQKPAEPQQQLKPPTPPAPPPVEIYVPPVDRSTPSPGPQPRSPTNLPEVVTHQQRPQTPKAPTPKPMSPEPISPEPLVINKRASQYQPFRPDGGPPSPSKYSSFNSSARGSPPAQAESKYVPFRAPEPPRTSQATPEPNKADMYKPYNPVSQPEDRKSPTPIGPERGSQYVPYDPKRASIIMSNTPVPGSGHSKRDSVSGAYPPPVRSDTLPASPMSSGSQPFGPLKGAKTFVDSYQPYTPSSAGYPSSAGSSNIFSTPESDGQPSKKRESYFPPIQEPIQPLQPRKAGASPIPEVLRALTAVLPADRSPRVKSTKILDEVRKTVEAVGEDFSFIDEINKAYNESAKKRRRKLDDERRKRAEEQEEYTDELFADHQIGYGDIKDMEMEFKSKESRREAKEEEEEYETYCSEVFQKVYDKLQEGIKGLMDMYIGIERDIPVAVAGKDRWITTGGVELTELLEGLLELRKYIEVRHEKVQAAVIERDRRFKKTVIQPLYTSGNIGKMKSMEKHFEESEKKAYVPLFATSLLSLNFALIDT